MTMPHTLLNLAEAAEYLHIVVEDLLTLVRDKEIPFELPGGRVMFRRGELDTWASRRILGLEEKDLDQYHRRSWARSHDLSREHAIVTELTRPGFVEAEIRSRTKPKLIREMVDLAAATDLLYDAPGLLEGLMQREELASTGFPRGVAILHPRHHLPFLCEDSFVILARAPHPIPFGAPDGSMTDIFFLLCSQDDRLHLHVLARICMLCQGTDLLDELREAADAEAMRDVLVREEAGLIERLVRKGRGPGA